MRSAPFRTALHANESNRRVQGHNGKQAQRARRRRRRLHRLPCGQGFSVREILETARRVTGRPIPALEAARRPGGPARLIGSSERIRTELGWKPRFTDIERIIATAWAWHAKKFG